MDMKALLVPYSEDGNRTLEGQVKWLQGKGVPQNHIDQAILSVYDEIEHGKKFADGHELDQYLLHVAKEHHTAEVSDNVQKLEDFFNSFLGKKRTLWQRIKAVFGR